MTLRLSPDGLRYQAMANGQAVPRPFALRWLWPWLLGDSLRAWWVANVVAALVLAATVTAGAYHQFDSAVGAAAAGVTLLSFPGVVDIHLRRFPMLVDLLAMALAAMAALATVVPGPVGIGICVVAALAAGASKETAPIFAALWAWSPLPLVGLAAPLLALGRRLGPEPVGVSAHAALAVTRPLQTARATHRGSWRDSEWLWPWGVGLVGFAWPGAWPAIVVAYAQCLVATDRVRLYQWAAPVVAVGVASQVQDWRLLPLVMAVALWRPFESAGV